MSTALGSSNISSKNKDAGLLILQFVVALMFLMAGGAKLAGAAPMVQMFNAIGIGQWFRYVTGGIEVFSALLLFTPRFSGVGALLLMCTMTGAILTHLFVIGGNPAFPIGLLVASAIIAWGRRSRTFDLLGDHGRVS